MRSRRGRTQVPSTTEGIIHARRTRPLSVYFAHHEIHILYLIDVILPQSCYSLVYSHISGHANTAMSTDPIPIGRGEPRYVAELRNEGIAVALVASVADVRSAPSYDGVHLLLLDTSAMTDTAVRNCVREFSKLKIPAIALVPEHGAAMFDSSIPVADVVILPPRAGELVLRARRVVDVRPDEGDDIIHADGLSINPTHYEVSVQGRSVNLRFKEYQLLLLMATNPGRVYTREQLLDRIWGYDYLGGTRTVDVHIRRLRSKIDEPDHQFIETVWNVGYKFKDRTA